MDDRIVQESPDGEYSEQVAVQGEDPETAQDAERHLVDVGQVVVVQVELLEPGQGVELISSQLSDAVVLQVKLLQAVETGESVVSDGNDLAGVDEETTQVCPSQEALRLQVSQRVPVQPHFSGVKGKEQRDVVVPLGRAGDDVVRPGSVVQAVAAVRALEATVAGEEVAAHALGRAVCVVGTEEVLFARLQELHPFSVMQAALQALQVHNDAGGGGEAGTVGARNPGCLAIALQGITNQGETWSTYEEEEEDLKIWQISIGFF